ncbi:MAG: hypothetical protein Q7V10_07855 [Methanobacteriaceae archaeon]|nr:hypothetical protein [Methanobacteriaceae archaeon]MDO9626964.1 hypothetical protein [Methanobacteriaceae archaeon]
MSIFLIISGIILVIISILLLIMTKKLPEGAKRSNYLVAIFCTALAAIVLVMGII